MPLNAGILLVDEPGVGSLVRIAACALALPLVALALASLALGALGESERDRVGREAQTAVREWTGGADSGAGHPAVGLVRAAFEEPETYGSPFVCASFLALAALLLGIAFRPRRRASKARAEARANARAAGARGPQPEQPALSRREHKKARKTADALAAAEGPEAAGDYVLGLGLRDEAAKWFGKADLASRVAEVRHDQNRFEESAELYEKAGRYESAGSIYAQLERFDAAARCYLQANKLSVAGEMFERAGVHEEAGRCYREIGFHRHAANAYLQAGNEREAARSLVDVFNEECGRLGGENDGARQELRTISSKAAKLLCKLQRLDEAETLLVRAGLYAQAGKVAVMAKAFDRASELYLRAGRQDLAAESLEHAGDATGAARLRGQYLRDQGEDEAAVRYLNQAGEHQDAADLYRRLERHEEAAASYWKANDPGSAAEMFVAAGEHARAADAYEAAEMFDAAAEQAARTGDAERQARLLEAAGQVFEAGRAYAQLERQDEAIRLLQAVEAGHPQFKEACALLGSLFRSKGMHTLSIKKLEEAANGEPVTRSTVGPYYELAQQLEERDDPAQAAEIYERILAFDYHYCDVAERLEQAKAQAQKAENTVGGGLPRAASDRYRILRELGRGGMGVVFLARDTVLDRDVAFKVLPEGLRGNQNALRNFLREAKAAAQLNHPHIVTVYDAGDSEHGFYLAMECVDGTTLKEILRRKSALPPAGVVYILRQMADALAFAHSKKVVHRDIKTANTMWTRDKQVKIMDFGLAKLMEEVRNATTLVSGTPYYMSPEQTLGRDVDHRTDLYSLGVTAFELSTGVLPFHKGNVPYHHVHTAPPDPRELNEALPGRFAELVLRLLAKDPAERFQSAADVLKALDQLASR